VIVKALDDRISAMLDRPAIWGGPEAYELQLLLLIEIRYSLRRNDLQTAYAKFLSEVYPLAGARPASATTNDLTFIASLLKQFYGGLLSRFKPLGLVDVDVKLGDTILPRVGGVVSDRKDLDTTIGPDGMQKNYLVMSDEERAKGFVRPVRTKYVHLKCGVVTRMGEAIAETYAREPKFYSGTFCVSCRAHYPVGEDGEFVWDDGSGQKVGT
jgi:hypothetical protein